MTATNMEINYASDGAALVQALETVHRPGTYFSTGIRDVPMPTVEVAELGRLSFPVTAAQAETLLRMAAEKAPIGRGEQTVIDESVRKVWQVPLSAFTLTGKGWKLALKDVVDQVRDDLGCGKVTVEAELYKLLVYAEGGHFQAHRDTEKTEGMFGTLVITLPSVHTGGTLRIRHADQEIALDLCPIESAEIRFAAFYADCEHEVEPVKEGNRICLVYNLLRKQGDIPSSPPDDRTAVQAASSALRDWASVPKNPNTMPHKIIYLLEHKYTESSLSMQTLKGEDAALTRVLRMAAEQANFDLHLAMVHIQESGYFESYFGYGEEPDELDLNDAVVEDHDTFLEGWRTANDDAVDYGKMRFDSAEDLLPPGALDHESPDEENFHSSTGNEGASFDRAYLRAALVLWLKAEGGLICLENGLTSAIGYLASRARSAPVADRENLRFIAEQVVEQFGENPHGADHIPRIFDGLLRLGFIDLLQEIWRGPLLEIYDGSCNEVLSQSLPALALSEAESCLADLFERYAICLPRDCLELWTFASALFPTKSLSFPTAFHILLKHLPHARQGKQGYRISYDSFLEETLHPKKEDAWYASHEPHESCGFPPEMLSETLSQLVINSSNTLTIELLQTLRANPKVFTIEDMLFPAFLHAQSAFRNHPGYDLLWQASAEALLERSEFSPSAPTDWADPTPLDEKGPVAVQLQIFLQDPKEETFVFRANQYLRSKMESLVRRHDLDLNLRTEKKGSPHILHLTKNRATYQKALKTYRDDQARMRGMINPSEHVPIKHQDLAERCRVASVF